MSTVHPVYTDVYDSTYLAYFCSQGKVVKKQYYGIGVLVGAMWLVFLANLILPIDLAKFGLYPRSFSGLLGIPLMPFLHANLDHLVGNTIPVAQPSPEMIAAELPPTESEQVSYFNVVYGGGASEHAASKLNKKEL